MLTEAEKEWRRKLLEWLRQNVPPDRADRLYTHLGDIRLAFTHAAEIIDTLPEFTGQNATKKLRQALGTLHVELFEHIPRHTREAQSDLTAWQEELVREEATGDV